MGQREGAAERRRENAPNPSSRFEPLNPTTPLPSLSSPSEGEERVAAGRERSGRPKVHGEGERQARELRAEAQALARVMVQALAQVLVTLSELRRIFAGRVRGGGR